MGNQSSLEDKVTAGIPPNQPNIILEVSVDQPNNILEIWYPNKCSGIPTAILALSSFELREHWGAPYSSELEA